MACHLRVGAELMPELSDLKLNEIPCIPLIITQHCASLKYAIGPAVCSDSGAYLYRYGNVVFKVQLCRKIRITLKCPHAGPILIPFTEL